MFRALTWTLATLLLALWSLGIWALHAVGAWTLAQAGGAKDLGSLELPAWLAAWVPPEWASVASEWLAGLAPLVEGLLQMAPLLSGGLTVISWLVWGLGALALLVVGALAHLLPSLWRQRAAVSARLPGRLAALR